MTKGNLSYYRFQHNIPSKRAFMRKVIQVFYMSLFIVLFTSCGESDSTTINPVSDEVLEDEVFENTNTKIPTLVVVMNWTNYSEDDPLIWYNKIFNKAENSVNRWYYDSTDANIELVPVLESSGTSNDGIVSVAMNKPHPGGYYDTTFRDVEIKNAIMSSEISNAIDFADFDVNNDGGVSSSELQIIFIVAGGEESYGDSQYNSIWAHSWSFESSNAPKVDGVFLMRTTSALETSGNYSRFGATHDIGRRLAHKATIGIMAHELGHSLFNLVDLYNTSFGHSGLGYYDIMSSGSWGKKTVDDYEGDTPTQFSAYSKIDTGIDTNITTILPTTTSSEEVTIKCSSNEYVKLNTEQTNEYFLLECRDTQREDSDRTFDELDSAFTTNRLFALLYHVDTDKEWNSEYGTQTLSNHYKVALVERDTQDALTSTDNIKAKFSDVYTDGYTIDSTKTKTYSGVLGYNIEVQSSNYTDRTMTFNIAK